MLSDNGEFSLKIAKSIVIGKLTNWITVLMRIQRTKNAPEAKDKANDFADKVKEKVQDVNLDGIKMPNKFKEKEQDESTTFTYTVNFDDEDGKK